MSSDESFTIAQLVMTLMRFLATTGHNGCLQLGLFALSLVQIRLNFVQFCKELGFFSSWLGTSKVVPFDLGTIEPQNNPLRDGLVCLLETLNLSTDHVKVIIVLLRLIILNPCFVRNLYVRESLVLGSESRTCSMPPPSTILRFGDDRVRALARGHPGALGVGVLRSLLQVNLDD